MHRSVSLGLACVLAAAACGPEDELVDGVFTADEWEKIKTLSPLPAPPDEPTNRFADDPDAADLGQMFFHEKGYAGPLLVDSALGKVGDIGKVACASCHEGEWMIDLHSKPNNATLGVDWLPRNSNSVVNAAYYAPWIENDGISDSMWADALVDLEVPIGFNSSRLRLVHVIWNKYRAEYDAVFDPDLDPALDPASPEAGRFPPEGKPGDATWDAMAPADQEIVLQIMVNFGKAIDAYLRQLVSTDAPFDRYVAGETDAIGLAAKRGLKLFVGKAGCVHCHDGPHFSDNQFHVNGLKKMGSHVKFAETDGRALWIERMLSLPWNSASKWSDDPGEGGRRLAELKDMSVEQEKAEWNGMWRTKALRQAAKTAPYMHTGQIATLREVVEFYNKGGDDGGFVGTKSELVVPLNLTEQEIDDLVAFLETLTGDPVPPELRADTSKADSAHQ
jgi:cytochrome c peroxidase